jgi:hypothetical protein
MLRTHLIICFILFLVCIPVYLIDHYTLKSSGSNWISLDFSNLLIKAYLVFLAIEITISTLAVIYYPHFSLLKTHLFSAIISLALLALGLFVYDKYDHANSRNKSNVITEQREKYFNDVQLLRWWFVPDAKNPGEIHVDLKVAAPGRFAANVKGNGVGEDGNNIFSSDGEPQHMVKAGETIHYVFPLTINNPGQANIVEFTFYLFKHPVGESGPDDVSKIFRDSVDRNDDGTYFYEKLLPPLARVPE